MTLRFTLLVVLILSATAAWSCFGSHRDRYETAPYKVVSVDGPIEIRDYPALKLATVKMEKAGSNGLNQSFGSLFGYISGKNETSTKIAMTTPVFMNSGQMSFVLPGKIAESGAPTPTDSGVSLTAFSGGRFAVLRFSGERSDASETKAVTQLRSWATSKGIEVDDAPVFAYYDPPFTLPKLRRNEVLLRIK